MGDDTNLTDFLKRAAKQAHSSPVSLTVRELLAYWGAQRRGIWVVARIRRDLEEYELTIDPDFTSTWIDSTITLIPQPGLTASPAPATEIVEAADLALPDVEMRVGQVRSANVGVVGVSRDDSLEKARTLMMRHDFSQLAVMSGKRDVLGAVTWESIADALLRSSDATVRDAMRSAEIVPAEAMMRPGFCAGSDPREDAEHAGTEEVQRRAA